MKALFLIFLLASIKGIHGAWMIDVEILNVTILHHIAYDGSSFCCCDICGNAQIYCFENLTLATQNCSADCSCEVNLNLCINYQGAPNSPIECYQTAEFFRDSQVFSFFKYSVPSSQTIYSLLQFTGGDSPPSNDIIMLNVTVTEQDGNNQTPMDSIVIPFTYQVQANLGDPVTYTTDGGILQMALAYRVYCADNYYGDRCEELCDCPDGSSGTTSDTANSVTPSTSTSTVTVYSSSSTVTVYSTVTSTGTSVTPTSNEQTNETSCVEWRITTVLLIIIMVFGIGVCCASCCTLICLRQFNRTKRANDRSAGVVAYSAVTNQVSSRNRPGGISNPSYEDKTMEAKEKPRQHPMEDYVDMNSKSSSDQFNKISSFPNTPGEENYEVMRSSDKYGPQQRTNFEKLNTPSDLENLSHTYEHVGTLDSNITGLSNDYEDSADEYNKLRR